MGALSCQNGSNVSFRHISPCTGLAYDARINAADQYSVDHSIWLRCRMVAAKFGLCTMSNICSLWHPSFLLHSFSLCCLCAMPLEHSPRLLLGFGNIIPHCIAAYSSSPHFHRNHLKPHPHPNQPVPRPKLTVSSLVISWSVEQRRSSCGSF